MRLLNRGRHRLTWAEYAARGRNGIRAKQNNAISNQADWVRGKSGCFPLWLRGRYPIAGSRSRQVYVLDNFPHSCRDGPGGRPHMKSFECESGFPG